ncbi:coniferyl aldehyde dehydrogenase [Marinobacter sp. SS21]|uniref:coniferyl aldehyde dehydrogenase n=1 Tax=Marinobacter sp. SS21 TaxID=2979460 RepID=UPI00232D165F|nr:coniferyl aldehyde dehydrogenase [Marinobacter sp. SS21]MDC0661418.1 coniferyl aldehyde dehydrogenase [Marinobacter sp. SS21]
MNQIAVSADTLEIERMQAVFERQQQAFQAQPFPQYQQRVTALKALIAALQRNKHRIVEALDADFEGRAAFETLQIEVLGPILQARHAISRLRRWMKPRRRKTELLFTGNRAWVEYQPKGVVGIVGPWNFPLYLTLGPLVTALAAGNRAMIKVSELSPNSRQVLETLLRECFSDDEVAVFGGEVTAAKAFTRLPFDHLVFTGAPEVGRQVMLAASENLVPVTLELGGKSPAIIGPQADLRDAALRIAHGKSFNAGQVCVAPDYVLVPKGRGQSFANAVKSAFEGLHQVTEGSSEYTSIVSDRHARRLYSLIDEAEAKGAQVIRCGPEGSRQRRMPLHVLTHVRDDMLIAREELFGPILPVIEYASLDEAIRYIRQRPRPLALYPMGIGGAELSRLLRETHSGGVTVGDWAWHVFQHDLPFGGIGNSGMGSYHGEEGFVALSHGKSVFHRRRWFPTQLFYPPYGRLVQRLALRWYLGR